jgi:transmembrane sensor
VRLSGEQRAVDLLAGEALFKVAPDPRRPFRVRSGDAWIEVLGTQFNVNRGASGTTVSVIEGRVEISGAQAPREPTGETAIASRLLRAGEQARIEGGGRIVHASIDPAEVAAWRQRRLVFRDSTLAEIAAEFNRYNRTPRIEVRGEALRARRYGGTFDADDPQALIEFLRPERGLVCETEGSTLLIRPGDAG